LKKQSPREDFDKSVAEAVGSFDPELILDIPIDELEDPIQQQP